MKHVTANGLGPGSLNALLNEIADCIGTSCFYAHQMYYSHPFFHPQAMMKTSRPAAIWGKHPRDDYTERPEDASNI